MIKFSGVTKIYSSHSVGLKDINLTIEPGEFVSIVGQSGAGKSTFIKILIAEERPTRGSVEIGDWDITKISPSTVPYLRRQLGVIFQDFKLLNDRNIFENIAIPLYIAGVKKEQIKKKVFDIAAKLGLMEYVNEMPYDLSGGEQQRVAIARAMITEPVLLLADEPTGNLDPFVALDIVKLLNEINKTGTTVIMATHNFDIVKKFSDKRIIQIKNKQLFDVRLKT